MDPLGGSSAGYTESLGLRAWGRRGVRPFLCALSTGRGLGEHGTAELLQREPEIVIFHALEFFGECVLHVRGESGRLFRRRWRELRGVGMGEATMGESQSGDRAITENAVNTLNNDRLQMLDLDCRGTGTYA